MKNIFVISTIAACFVGAVGLRQQFAGPGLSFATTSPSQVAAAPSDGSDSLVVHEWGTFTTFSGSDGVFLDFRPLAQQHQDLPSFVRDRTWGALTSLVSKSRLWGKVRMETPVTYFYTDRIRDVNVSVDFPSGLLTEFYPPVRKMLPELDEKAAFGPGEPLGHSRLDWGKVTLIPESQLVPNVEAGPSRDWLQGRLAQSALPHESNEQHYAQARATDSALVHVHAPHRPNLKATDEVLSDHLEKFLFYRGVGSFHLPLRATIDRHNDVSVSSESQDAFRSLILMQVEGQRICVSVIDELPGGTIAAFPPVGEVDIEELSYLVQERLVAEGLYPKEASAMVATWRDSWFQEEGTRLLYMVPESITNDVLPLSVDPAPSEMVRVLVGRMELMTTEAEERMETAVAASIDLRQEHIASEGLRSKVDPSYAPQPYPMPDSIAQYGRMTEPALVRTSKIAKSPEVRAEAERLLAELRAQ